MTFKWENAIEFAKAKEMNIWQCCKTSYPAVLISDKLSRAGTIDVCLAAQSR